MDREREEVEVVAEEVAAAKEGRGEKEGLVRQVEDELRRSGPVLVGSPRAGHRRQTLAPLPPPPLLDAVRAAHAGEGGQGQMQRVVAGLQLQAAQHEAEFAMHTRDLVSMVLDTAAGSMSSSVR